MVAWLLVRIEANGLWPSEWLDAFVTMIPKASGGSRLRDQHPMTVLPLLYRIWAKAIVLEWASTLHQQYLGSSAMGFRSQSGTIHLAQLLSDIIALQESQKKELWLASFDVEKCYDSLPWWAVFDVLRQA